MNRTEPARPPVTWGLSPLDCRHHAIDERAAHSPGVYHAHCGHPLLMTITTLQTTAHGHRCQACVDVLSACPPPTGPTRALDHLLHFLADVDSSRRRT